MLPKALTDYIASGGSDFAFTEGSPGYFQLWPVAEIQKCNVEYQVAEYAPGFTGFGSDGGGEMLAFDKDGGIYMMPFIGMSVEDAQKIADSWSEVSQRIEKE